MTFNHSRIDIGDKRVQNVESEIEIAYEFNRVSADKIANVMHRIEYEQRKNPNENTGDGWNTV